MRYRESYCDEICLGNLFTSFFYSPKSQKSFIDRYINQHLLIPFNSLLNKSKFFTTSELIGFNSKLSILLMKRIPKQGKKMSFSSMK